MSQSARPASDDQRDDDADHPGQPVQGQEPADPAPEGSRSAMIEMSGVQGSASRRWATAPDRPIESDRLNRNYTICLRFLNTHSAVSTARNRPSTGQVFQSGIGGSVSRGTFCGLGQVVEQRRRRSPACRTCPCETLGRADQLGLVHLDVLQLAGGRRRPGTRPSGSAPSRTGGGSSRTSYSPSAACGKAPSKMFRGRGDGLSVSLRGPCPLRSTWTTTSPPAGADAGVREPDADLDRLVPLVAAAVGLDLGLLLADQLRPGEEPDRLDPEPAEVAVADAEPPAPGVVDGVEHRPCPRRRTGRGRSAACRRCRSGVGCSARTSAAGFLRGASRYQ